MFAGMRVLITGITGFAGSHLAEYILAEHPDVAVFGTYRWRARMEHLDTLIASGVLAVRREQGRSGQARVPVLQVVRPAPGGHAGVQPHRPAPRNPLRYEHHRAPDRVD